MEQFLLYKSESGKVRVEVLLQEETIWLTQKALADLFQVGVPAIAKHIGNIYESHELTEDTTVSKMETVQQEGRRTVKRTVIYYNLDVIIAVGYRVNSIQATHFRIWATNTLKEFIIKGFVLDDERLKQGRQLFGKDYFDELLERIREIRVSERRFCREKLFKQKTYKRIEQDCFGIPGFGREQCPKKHIDANEALARIFGEFPKVIQLSHSKG